MYSIRIYSGPGDGFYSSWFQSILKNNTLHNASMPEGESKITDFLKNQSSEY